MRSEDEKIGLIGEPVIHAGIVVALAEVDTSTTAFQPLRVETIAHDGGYAVSFGIDISPSAHHPNLRIIVDIAVETGAIGIGCLSQDFSSFVDVENLISVGPRRKIYVAAGVPGSAKHLILRNASHEGASVARVHGIEIRHVDAGEERRAAIQSSLWDAPVVASWHFHRSGGDAEAARRTLAALRNRLGSYLTALTVPLAVTHTSRVWDRERCAQDFLRERYRRSDRLTGLPEFEELPSAEQARAYSGRLTLFDLTVDESGIHFTATRCIDSEHKVNHACKMGDQLVVCLDDYLAVLPASLNLFEDRGRRIERIDDPWFAGLQMIFPVDDTHCVISASAPDALMLLDLPQRRVVRRWRVPAERYGRNYELTETMSVHDHFIANDMQLTHLNCAYPDGRGGFWISTLAQGDIGYVAADGAYEVVASGFVGCHGIRDSRELDCLYFSDSCTGHLIGIGADRAPRVIGTVDSRWLHDAQHLAGDLFLLSLGDRNAIVVLDTASNTEVARFDMRVRGENVQFLNLVGEPLCRRI